MTHEERVAAVCDQMRAATGRVHVHKGGVHHFVPRPGDGRFSGAAVDVSALREILEVDAGGADVHGRAGRDLRGRRARAPCAHGLLPKVVPELEGITLGGAVAGCSVESMSYRYGGFHDTCTEYEVVDGTGERRVLGPGDELFHMVHGSYGTLGDPHPDHLRARRRRSRSWR